MKTANILAMLFCIAYCIHAEWQVYQHYLVISRDYYPITRDFVAMYAERLGNCIAQCSACVVGIRAAKLREVL